jgi:hypothetical protein
MALRSVFKNLNGKSKVELADLSDIFFSSGETELSISPLENKMLLIRISELFVLKWNTAKLTFHCPPSLYRKKCMMTEKKLGKKCLWIHFVSKE